MKFRLEFDCDNAAFADAERSEETARILRKVMGKIGAGEIEGVAMDSNGNRVGSWAFTGETADQRCRHCGEPIEEHESERNGGRYWTHAPEADAALTFDCNAEPAEEVAE